MTEEAPLNSKIAESPAHGRAYWIQAEDQIRLRIACWTPAQTCKGTVLLFPGRTEYIEKLGRTVTELDQRGFACVAIDWRGQGLADRLTENRITSHVGRFSDYQKDVAAMIKSAEDLNLPKPWYLLGHSMGALIGLRSLINGLEVNACAFTAPLWGIPLSPIERAVAWPLTWAGQAIGRGDVFAPGNKAQEDKCYVLSVGFDENRLTSDPEMFDYMVNQARGLPDLQTGAPSMGWVYEALKECRDLAKLPSPQLPCIAFCGDRDVVVDISAVEERVERWADTKYEVIKTARHDLLSESPEIRDGIFSKVSELFRN
ncbi:alpha/beta hydrolase [Parasulfitobacter algicola]|uniref:Alpha/beta hydrolase n=1 Tax=Parasulfitobacter algicola TaxID=2614809 RepID=A0ABX2IV50_9RHOB|nr:alpha/beta hydrolase [Sulfitobacter algicola]NSX56787.1 alpha/beta hydrolase [Sulfitobacter algicola]